MTIDVVIQIPNDKYLLFLVPRTLKGNNKDALFLPGEVIYDSLLNSKWINKNGSYKSLDNKSGISASIMPLDKNYRLHVYSKGFKEYREMEELVHKNKQIISSNYSGPTIN